MNKQKTTAIIIGFSVVLMAMGELGLTVWLIIKGGKIVEINEN